MKQVLWLPAGMHPLDGGQVQSAWGSLLGGLSQFKYLLIRARPAGFAGDHTATLSGTLPASWGRDFPYLEALQLSSVRVVSYGPHGKHISDIPDGKGPAHPSLSELSKLSMQPGHST